MQRRMLSTFFLASFLGCHNEAVRKTSERHNEPVRETSVRSTTPNQENTCAPDSVAAQYHVFREPANAIDIMQTYAKGDAEKLRAEPRLRGVRTGYSNDEKMPLICLGWKMNQSKLAIDLITCHAFGGFINYPITYTVFRVDDATPDKATVDLFIDKDIDGDICDPEFTHLERQTMQLSEVNTPDTSKK